MAIFMSYGDYLHLDGLLDNVHPISQAHDEYLFIIQHQTSELWMKLAVREIMSAKQLIAVDDLKPAFKLLSRLSRIFEQLNNAWDVLRTMTPSDYTEFRASLGGSSGFQSYQYREIEFLLGNKNKEMLKPHASRPDIIARLELALNQTSIYDEVNRLLVRSGFKIPDEHLARNPQEAYKAHESVEAAWSQVYRNSKHYWDLYELAEKLIDIEDYFRRWRFNHVTTVERVIGFKRGTGGSTGVEYLKRMLSVVLFPELWSVRTAI